MRQLLSCYSGCCQAIQSSLKFRILTRWNFASDSLIRLLPSSNSLAKAFANRLKRSFGVMSSDFSFFGSGSPTSLLLLQVAQANGLDASIRSATPIREGGESRFGLLADSRGDRKFSAS